MFIDLLNTLQLNSSTMPSPVQAEIKTSSDKLLSQISIFSEVLQDFDVNNSTIDNVDTTRAYSSAMGAESIQNELTDVDLLSQVEELVLNIGKNLPSDGKTLPGSVEASDVALSEVDIEELISQFEQLLNDPVSVDLLEEHIARIEDRLKPIASALAFDDVKDVKNFLTHYVFAAPSNQNSQSLVDPLSVNHVIAQPQLQAKQTITLRHVISLWASENQPTTNQSASTRNQTAASVGANPLVLGGSKIPSQTLPETTKEGGLPRLTTSTPHITTTHTTALSTGVESSSTVLTDKLAVAAIPERSKQYQASLSKEIHITPDTKPVSISNAHVIEPTQQDVRAKSPRNANISAAQSDQQNRDSLAARPILTEARRAASMTPAKNSRVLQSQELRAHLMDAGIVSETKVSSDSVERVIVGTTKTDSSVQLGAKPAPSIAMLGNVDANRDLRSNVQDQVAQAITRQAHSTGRLTLSLAPRELGALDIEFRNERGEVQVIIVAREQPTRDLLDTVLPRLRQSLEDAGVVVGKLELSQDNDTAGGSTFADQRTGQQESQHGRQSEIDEPSPDQVDSQRILSSDHAGQLDVYV